MSSVSPESIREAVDRHSAEILDWTMKLVSFPSENRPPRGSEGAAQAWVKNECESIGLPTETFAPPEIPGAVDHPWWLSGRDYGEERLDMVARWVGTGGGRSLLLSGHMDVAPADSAKWQICEPFKPTIRGSRLYGRGAADMKGGIASAFWAMRILRELSFHPWGSVLFETVVDEEFAGGNGTLASRLAGNNADLAVYMEPTMMELCTSGMGAFLGDFVLRTERGGMPYTGHTIPNPIQGAARVIEHFREWEAIWRSENRDELFSGPGKALNVVLWNAGIDAEDTTAQMGIPDSVRISWIVWCYPGVSEGSFYTRFREYWNECFRSDKELKPFEFELEPTYHFIRPWASDTKSPAVQATARVYADCTRSEAKPSGTAFSSDMAVYGEVGRMPTVVLGPRGDNLHTHDEWVSTGDILKLTEVFATLITEWCVQE